MIDTNNSKIGNPFPFRVFCQKVIPLAFDESLSYLELLYSLLHYIKEVVIPAVNNNADAVTELQNLYNELKSYVDNYFENLDVQEEINNKLDEMAESGQLADIIAQYLQLAGVLAFDNVNDMKNATNLVNGSIVKTLGFYSYNDGGGAFYKIRTITNQDNINNIDIFAITNSNNLIAELIESSKMYVKQYGAKGDGLTDDTNILQYIIEKNIFGNIYFNSGTFLINSPLKTYVDNNKQTNIYMEKTTIIKTNNNLDCLFELGGLGGNNDGVNNRLRIIQGGILDATNCVSGIKINENSMGITIKDMEIKNFSTYGIYVPKGETVYSSDLYITNCYINGLGSHLLCYGLYIERPDNNINNLRINAIQIGIHFEAGGQFLNNIHGLVIGNQQNLLEWFNKTRFIEIENGGGNFFTQLYSDTFCTFIYCNSSELFTLTNSFSYSYINNISQKLFIFTQQTIKAIIKDNNFALPDSNTLHQGIIINNFDPQFVFNKSNFIIENNIVDISKLENGDLLAFREKFSPFWQNTNNTLSNTQWLLIGYMPICNYVFKEFEINIDGFIYKCSVKLERFNGTIYPTYRSTLKSNNDYGLKIGFKYIHNNNGYDVVGVYLQQTSGSLLKTDISIQEQNQYSSFIPINNNLQDANNYFINSVDSSYDL